MAHAYGLALLPKYDERRGVALSTEAAAHYLADLHERLGSWELGLFAFAQGYARTMAALQKHTSLEYWDLVSELPPDGTTYVAEILAVATMLDNPDRFGLDVVKPDEPEVTSDLEVPADATFSILARAAGTSVARLRELNPEYLSDSVPSTNFALTMHLPECRARPREGTSHAAHVCDQRRWGAPRSTGVGAPRAPVTEAPPKSPLPPPRARRRSRSGGAARRRTTGSRTAIPSSRSRAVSVFLATRSRATTLSTPAPA